MRNARPLPHLDFKFQKLCLNVTKVLFSLQASADNLAAYRPDTVTNMLNNNFYSVTISNAAAADEMILFNVNLCWRYRMQMHDKNNVYFNSFPYMSSLVYVPSATNS